MRAIDRRTMLGGAAALAALGPHRPAMSRGLGFDALDGWARDDHRAALLTWQQSCKRVGGRDLCRIAEGDPRAFFETYFEPQVIGNPADALFTGYYEPVIRASKTRSDTFPVPIYAPPRDLERGRQHLSRARIEAGGLEGRGLELFWLADRVDRYFLQIQGSGRLKLPNGQLVRVGYAGKNGHPYISIGKIFNRRRAAQPGTFGAAPLKAWLRQNPRDGAALMQENPSFIFFTVRDDLAPDQGPVGALGVPLTAGRSMAVDPELTALGLPVWVETEASTGPIRRLMIAQDTGSAIKGPQRGDLFFGTGDRAGEIAGSMAAGGRMVSLIPKPELRRLIGRE